MSASTCRSRADRLLHLRALEESGFGDLNQHGPDSIRFYTKTKTVTARWPSGSRKWRSSRFDDEVRA